MDGANPRRAGFRCVTVGCLTAALAVVAGVATWVWCDSRRGWRAETLERLIREEVPAGCARREAEGWFDRHGIRHSYFADTTGDQYGHDTMPTLAGLRAEDLGGMVRGTIDGSDANVGFLATGTVQVYFFFDKRGLCVGHLVCPFMD